MLGVRVFPCLLLKNSGLVKTIKFQNPRYIGDPINTVKIYNEKEVDELVFLDIAATTENRKPPFNIISQIASECFMPFAYGGGIRSLEDIKTILSIGAEKVVINSYAVETPSFIKEAGELFGSQSIIVSIDAKKHSNGSYYISTHGGNKSTKINSIAWATKMEEMGAGEILLNSIDRDGTMEGYDLELTKKVSEAVSIPVIACGGAGKYEDIGKVVEAGASAVTAGSLFVYQGKNRSVLINFPTRKEIEEILGRSIEEIYSTVKCVRRQKFQINDLVE